ncbi:MAG TPA: alpha-L-arabinofuranosidase C-terminal domain-containing protein [Isosphaeraceae bacterium]|jgi:alpha-N-arabinofuranosidase|nr:alpha-L-arabinofuranosidase C-terminal domain-containing protein [Isosphaeraceae bacterium]
MGTLQLAILLPLVVTGLDDEGRAPALTNAGFEAREPLAGWEVVTYGVRAEVAVDDKVAHEGRQSLRVSADEPTDTALGQEITLTPGHWYRFRGWVRTRGIDPLGSNVSGTYQVQNAAGRGILAAGPSQRGDTEWTEVALTFRAPGDGRVRVAPFLVGFGKGKGTAWFDDLAIEPIDPAKATVVVTREPLRTGRIEQGQYGQFVEYLCDLVPSMWADTLCDGSFEGLTPYKVVYLKETDDRQRPWYPCGATNRARFGRDETTKVSGSSSYRVAAEGRSPCTVGIAQGGIALRRGVACEFSCNLKEAGLNGPVRARLQRDGTVYAEAELRPTKDWRKHHARLVPNGDDDRATITIDFHGPGTLWLDNAALMPEDAVDGWRSDVIEAVKAMRPGVIRFGGSTLDDPERGEFEWRDTVGDPDHRRPFRAWGGLQPTGPGLEEIVRFCRLVGAEPLICVRSTRRSPRDAADQVQYFNGGVDTPMGALRARNGHPEPYRIRYWQVGNEQGGSDYESRLPEFCRAMKQADPTIRLLSSYPSPGVLRGSGEWLDLVAPHHYDIANLAAAAADLEAIRRMIRENAPGRPIRVAVTEWNTTGGDWGPPRARLWTLENALACARYQNLLHRNCDLVTIANRSNLINSFCSGCIQTDNRRLYVTPTYHAQRLYATRAGDRPLRIDSPLPADSAPDLSATLAAEGDAVVLLAVNDGPEPVVRPLDFSAFGRDGQELEVWTLADSRQAGEPDATNGFADLDRIAPRRSTFPAAGPRFEYRFPALSLTVLRWRVSGSPDAGRDGRLRAIESTRSSQGWGWGGSGSTGSR